MFDTLLIANRGEIACRVIRTARMLGIRTVAVHSEADAGALHVRDADIAVCIGPPPARESYLRGDRILEAARNAGADAIHPGYGFLSENADFAEACSSEGIIFVGPSASAIRAMGNKDEAKRRMEAANVPVVPGEHGENQQAEAWTRAAEQIGYPVLIKAVAGGGGKGMRKVERPDDLEAALEGAAREAESAFGDARILVEKWLEPSRHVEIQVFADGQGNAVHLFERDCSLQRRHQKVLEEAPAPGLPEPMLKEMGAAAVRAAQAIDYCGAGTVEFIVDLASQAATPSFYFMEMNTRLQVEHPVTEAITGVDLVEWQLRVASGEPLPLTQNEITASGHAIEVRVYAEDPARRYLPQTGTLLRHRPPTEGAGIRVDNGVAEGDAVEFHYDPMISKLIVHDRDRDHAIRKLAKALGEYEIAGLTTNLGLLHAVARHPAFAAGRISTTFLQDHDAALTSGLGHPPPGLVALACAFFLVKRAAAAFPQAGDDPFSPWAQADSFRLNEDGLDSLQLACGKSSLDILIQLTAEAATLEWEGHAIVMRAPRVEGDRVIATLDGRVHSAGYAVDGDIVHVSAEARTAGFEIVREQARQDTVNPSEGEIRAPMPGKITAVLVAEGDQVKRGQVLITLEAMKMEHSLAAPADGRVEDLNAELGRQVDEGQKLLQIS